MIQIRDLSDDVHRALRVKAAAAGLSLSAYLRQELEALAHRKSVGEVLDGWPGERPDIDRSTILEAVRTDRP